MPYIQHNNPFRITSCGRRRTFMQGGDPGHDRTEGNPFGRGKTDKEKKNVLKRNETPTKCWEGYERVPGTKEFSKGSCRKKSPNKMRKTTKGKGRTFRTSEEGAGMTAKGVSDYKKENPGSKLQTAVTGKVKPGSKAAKRRKSFCARSKGWTGERGKAARARWKC